MNPEGHLFVAFDQNGESYVCSSFLQAKRLLESDGIEGVIHKVKTEIVYFRKEAKDE